MIFVYSVIQSQIPSRFMATSCHTEALRMISGQGAGVTRFLGHFLITYGVVWVAMIYRLCGALTSPLASQPLKYRSQTEISPSSCRS